MKSILRIALWTAAVLIVLSLGLVVYLRNADLSVYEDQIEEFLSTKIGHKLDIGGNFNLQVRGETKLLAESVTLSNDTWQENPQLLSVGHLAVTVDTWSLISGPIVINDLKIENVDVNIEFGTDGRANWSTGAAAEQADSDEEVDTGFVAFRNVAIDDVTVTHVHPTRSRPLIVTVDSLRVSPDASEILDLDLQASVNDIPLWADGKLGPWRNLITGKDITADLDATLGHLKLAVSGSVEDLVALVGVEATFSIDGPSIDRITSILDIPTFATGAFEVDGRVRKLDNGRQLRLEGNLGEIEMLVSGALDDLRSPIESAFDFNFSGPDANSVAELFDIVGVPAVPYRITGEFGQQQRRLTFSEMRAQIGDNSVAIDGFVDTAHMPPELDMTVDAAGPNFAVFAPFLGIDDMPAEAFDVDGRVRKEGSDWQFDNFTALVGANRVTAAGSIKPGVDSEIVINATGPDNSFLHALTGLEGLPPRPYDISARIRPDQNGLKLEQTSASFGEHRIEVEGVVAIGNGLVGTRLVVSAGGPELHNVALLTGVPYLPGGPFDIGGTIALDGDGLVLDEAVATVGPLQAKASGSVGLAGNMGNFDLELSATGPDVGKLANFDVLQRLTGESFSAAGKLQRGDGVLTFNTVEVSIGTLEAFINGTYANEPRRADISVRIAAENASVIGRLVDLQGLPDGAFRADGRVELGGDELELSDTELRIGDYALNANGTLSVAPLSNDSDLKFSASGPDLERLLVPFGVELFPARAFTVGGEFQGTPSGFAMRDFVATIGDNNLRGTFTANLRDKPTLSGSLSSTYLDLTERVQQAGEQTEAAKPDESGLLFPDQPLETAFLDAANADFDISVDHLRISQTSVQDFRLGLLLENGALTISPFSYRGARGTVNGSLALRPANDLYELEASVDVDDARFSAPDSADAEASLRPPIDGQIEVRGSGESLHAIMASSNGRVSLRQGSGQVRNRGSRLFGDLAMEVIRTINPLATESEYRRFDCGIYEVTIVDGVATLDEFAFQTDKLTTVVSGKVTFADEKIDIALRAKPREGIGISIGGLANSFVKIGGSLKSPQLILDTKGAAATTGAAVVTGGLSLLGKGLLDRLSAAADMCKQAEEEASTQESEN